MFVREFTFINLTEDEKHELAAQEALEKLARIVPNFVQLIRQEGDV
jgi:hypothetical protein